MATSLLIHCLSLPPRKAARLVLAAVALLGIEPAAALSPGEIQTRVLGDMDLGADPCNDFYRYACGGWLDRTTIPEDKSTVFRAASAIHDTVRADMLVLLQDAAANPGAGGERAMLGNFFSACLDSVTNDVPAERGDISVLQPYLTLIDGIGNSTDFLRVAGRLGSINVPAIFDPRILPAITDSGEPRTYWSFFYPGDLGFPDSDMYLKRDAFNKLLLKEQRAIVALRLSQLGDSQASAHAADIIWLEKILAKYHPDYYHGGRLMFARPFGFNQLSPTQNWLAYFEGLDYKSSEYIVVDRDYLRKLGSALRKLPPDSLRAYLRWKLLSHYESYMPGYFQKLPPDLQAALVLGQPVPWKRCVDVTSELLPDAVAKAWVSLRNDPAALTLGSGILATVKTAFLGELSEVAWLTPASRTSAKAKVGAVDVGLGYPERWTDYSGLSVGRNTYLANTIAAQEFQVRSKLGKIGTAVNPLDWLEGFTASTANAAYFRLQNRMFLPLAMMQAPLAHPDYPAALNYGGAGFVIGHEFTHALDAGGRYYNRNGYFEPVIDAKSGKAFDKQSQCLVRQYGKYKIPLTNRGLRGKAILNENIADNGGLRLARMAFDAAASPTKSVPSGIGTLTQEQLFYVGFAQANCSKSLTGLETYLSSRTWYSYAPSQYRVNGPLSNSPEFAAAFACPPGASMAPVKECQVW